MIRRFFSLLLRADLEPGVEWSEAEAAESFARISIDVPRPFSGTDTMEQVLCKSGDEYVLLKRSRRSGHLSRVSFRGPFAGDEMRLTECQTEPRRVFRLQFSPVDSASITCRLAVPTWFHLWRNVSHVDLGAGICFMESANREQLRDLRFRLLDGRIPDSLHNEEEMWDRINSMSESDRRAALATLTMQSLDVVDRQFHTTFPNAGPIPEELKPVFAAMQDRIREIERTSDERPIDPELEKLMDQFVANAARRVSKNRNRDRKSDSP